MNRPEENFDELIGKLISLPVSKNKKVVRIRKGNKVELIVLHRKETILTQDGSPATEEGIEVLVLGDGTSFTGEEKVSVCQKCGKIVNQGNIMRCECGKTICLRKGCGKIYAGKWFCGFRCYFLSRLGLLRKF